MKIKALRERDSKLFLEIIRIDDTDMAFTSVLPRPLSPDATVEMIKEYYENTFPDVNLSFYELVEFELTEINVTKLI